MIRKENVKELHDKVISRFFGLMKSMPPHHLWETIEELWLEENPQTLIVRQQCFGCKIIRLVFKPNPFVPKPAFKLEGSERGMMTPFTQGVLTGVAADEFYRRYFSRGGRRR